MCGVVSCQYRVKQSVVILTLCLRRGKLLGECTRRVPCMSCTALPLLTLPPQSQYKFVVELRPESTRPARARPSVYPVVGLRAARAAQSPPHLAPHTSRRAKNTRRVCLSFRRAAINFARRGGLRAVTKDGTIRWPRPEPRGVFRARCCAARCLSGKQKPRDMWRASQWRGT